MVREHTTWGKITQAENTFYTFEKGFKFPVTKGIGCYILILCQVVWSSGTIVGTLTQS